MKTKLALGAVVALSIVTSTQAADEAKSDASHCPHHPCPMMSGDKSSMQDMHKDMHGTMGDMEAKKEAQEYATQGKVVAIQRRSPPGGSKAIVQSKVTGITLAHEPVPALKWPAMTMEFALNSPDLARGLRPGDAVMFRFIPRGNSYVVTQLEKAKS